MAQLPGVGPNSVPKSSEWANAVDAVVGQPSQAITIGNRPLNPGATYRRPTADVPLRPRSQIRATFKLGAGGGTLSQR